MCPEILQRPPVLINHGTFERDVRNDEGISSFPIARGNWKASSRETGLRHARVMRDFPSRKSGNPRLSIKKIKKFPIYYIRYDSNLIVTENDFSPHKRTFRGYLISRKTIYPLRKCSCLHHRNVITLLSCRRHR